jgi:HEAT repeat protein
MPGKRAFEEQLEALDALRQQPAESRIAPLRKALGHKNNFIVAKAANLIHDFGLKDLEPDLLAAFDRFFDDPVKTDPQCWAKNAISRTLAAMELQDEQVFLRGMRHIQMEPVWGGSSDTAGTLRATCALALVQCRSLTERDLLAHLVELLADKDKTVRVEVVRGIEQVGSPSAALLLRLRAVLGAEKAAADEPEVLGACYGGILRVEGVRAIPWVRRFLAAADENAGEAALAIAGTHSPEAFEALRESFPKADDPWWRSVLLSAIALTRQEAALEFLLELVRTESLDAEATIEAVLRSVPSQEVVKRLEKLVENNPRLARAFAANKKESP